MSLISSISGIRGIVGSGLTPDVIVRYAAAFAEYCGRRPIVIGRDGRVTGKPIANIVASTLLSAGCDVIALGVCPTPTVQMAVARLKSAGGISITASHNPIEWNGLKFLAATGMFLDRDQHERLQNILQKGPAGFVPWNKLGRHRAEDSFLQEHVDEILRIPYLNPGRVRRKRFKVVVDCVNASGGRVVPQLLRAFGCRVVEMNCDASGIFAHTPEPLPENLTALCRRVRREQADLGIAVDPDGDRLVLIDERGKPFGEEYTIVQAVKFVLEQEKKRKNRKLSPVVVNLSTTRAVEDVARQFGTRVIRTPVGEINVASKMKEVGSIIGGEGSGGVILSTVHLGRDALVGIGLTLQHLAEFGGTLSELRRTLPGYVMTKHRIKSDSRDVRDLLARLAKRYEGKGAVNFEDGIRIDFERSWVHLRPSNTEPIIRIISEGPDETHARSLAEEIMGEIAA